MGFFSDAYYSEEAMQERADTQRAKDAAQRNADKARRKAHEAKLQRKKALRDEQYRESEEFQKKFSEQFGATSRPDGGARDVKEGDASTLYDKYNPKNYGAYQDEIARRYGYLYHSSSTEKAPTLDRGLGAAHHQKVDGHNKFNAHPLGPLAKRIRIPIGFGDGGGQHNPENAKAIKHGSGSKGSRGSGTGGSGIGGGGGSKLNRPL